jgi:hypothetical protein
LKPPPKSSLLLGSLAPRFSEISKRKMPVYLFILFYFFLLNFNNFFANRNISAINILEYYILCGPQVFLKYFNAFFLWVIRLLTSNNRSDCISFVLVFALYNNLLLLLLEFVIITFFDWLRLYILIAVAYLARTYSSSSLSKEEIERCLHSINDNNTFLYANRDPCEKVCIPYWII